MSFLYPISSLFFYRLIVMAWMLLGEALFLFRLERRKHFVLRVILAVLSCFLFALIFPIPTSIAGNAFYQMFMFLLFFVFTYFAACAVFVGDIKQIFFSCVCGYTSEHIAFETYFAISNFLIYDELNKGNMYDPETISLFQGPWDQICYFFSYIIIYWLIFIFFANRIHPETNATKRGGLKILVVGTLFLFIDIVLNSAAVFYGTIHYERIYMAIVASINVVSCVIGLCYLFEMFYSNHVKREYDIISEIRKEEKNQYMMSKQTIDLINIKCHDLKHQIHQIGSEQNIDDKTIKNISKLISIYDSSIMTSNSALNVILNEKSLYCTQNGIKFSCIADGSLLDFMAEEDIYSLFGNIIDNAIEAVTPLEEGKKIIHLKITKTGNMISISAKNSFEGEVKIINGLPQTTKNDSTHHGFGLKSIKMICEKYHGTLNFQTLDNCFNINLLFLEQEK